MAGFLVYGGWAYFVNQSHGQQAGINAGLTQGSYSFVLTLSTTFLMEHLMLMLAEVRGRKLITIGVTSAITLGIAYLIHWLMGTPEIWLTILPGFAIGTAYTVTYVMAISSVNKHHAATPQELNDSQ